MTASRVLIFEPLGARELLAPIRLGAAEAADVRLPDSEPDRLLTIEYASEGWLCHAAGQGITLNGIVLEPNWAHQVQRGDVLRIGEAVVRVTQQDADLVLRIEHLEGNETIPPSTKTATVQFDEQAEELITATRKGSVTVDETSDDHSRINQKWIWGSLAALAVVMAVLMWVLGRLQPVTFAVDPDEASVRGSGVGWTSGNTLFLLPGERTVSATAEGYVALQQTVTIRADQPTSLELRLEPLPGILQIDTGGVAAEFFVDGARVGVVPGEIEVRQGTRTLTIRADKYFDEIRSVTVEGFGVRQLLSVPMRPSWGRLTVSADRPQATLVLEGRDPLPLPADLDLPAGLHRLEVQAPEAKPWRGAVLVEAGGQQTIGPISLGAPDAIWTIRSRPAGATVTVNGVFRGRTPVDVTLTPQLDQQIVVGEQGFAQVERRVRPQPGERQVLQVELAARQVSLAVSGDPAGVDVFLGARKLGVSPLEIELPARRATLELRKDGYSSQRLNVDLSAGVARRLEYRLVPEGRDGDWRPPALQLELAQGPVLRLIEGGSFLMGSGRREQGRRSNEWQRQVTLSRAFYIGAREVSNGEFRRFRPDHASGFIGKRSLDLDRQAVTAVSWDDAVEYCNWLSEQNGLPPAYRKQEGRWLLVQPVNTGFRLPTEAEWEFVARVDVGRGVTRRYPWGMALPPPTGSANLAGEEATADLPRVLAGWRDEHVVVTASGTYPANSLGLYDLLGNVSEWVHDAYATAPEGEPTDPAGPVSASRLRVIKGTSWRSSNFAELRAAWRDGRDSAADDVGFRVARYVEGSSQ